ncbi:MAG: zinc-ribbon domain-containing protein, partial [Chloroflexota bacterium]
MNHPPMIACPNCGAMNRTTARFCSQCRAPLVVAEQPTIRLPDDSKAPFAERRTRRMSDSGKFAALPEGALIGKYEVRQLFPAQSGVNSYLVAD